MNPVRKTFKYGEQTVTLETGRIARQASGAVVVTIGNITVLCTVVGAKSAKAGQDFFPLSVHYIEKTFAAGKIPGGFFKREGRLSEKETLTSRLIDRPIRPLFPSGFRNEVQVLCTLDLGYSLRRSDCRRSRRLFGRDGLHAEPRLRPVEGFPPRHGRGGHR